MRLKRIDWQTLLLQHCYLDLTAECYFANEYGNPNQPAVREEILSLKQGNQRTISKVAQQLRSALPLEWTDAYTFVPMPPSSGSASPLQSMVKELHAADSRNLIVQILDTPSSHNGWRPTPEQRALLMALNQRELEPVPKAVVVVDDVLATGSHFCAAKMIIRRMWPDMRVVGLFLGRACWKKQRGNSEGKFGDGKFGDRTELTSIPPMR